MSQLLTAEQARASFAYDPETGVLLWITCRRKKKEGARAGHFNKTLGYRTLGVHGRAYLEHRVVWLMVHGEWPDGEIDHINRVRDDNRIANLRDVSRSTNNENRRVAQANNQCGLLGASFCKTSNRWRAQIVVAGVSLKLGRYDTPALAHAAYVEAKRRLHAGCTL